MSNTKFIKLSLKRTNVNPPYTWTSLLSKGTVGSFPGGKATGAWGWTPTSILCRS